MPQQARTVSGSQLCQLWLSAGPRAQRPTEVMFSSLRLQESLSGCRWTDVKHFWNPSYTDFDDGRGRPGQGLGWKRLGTLSDRVSEAWATGKGLKFQEIHSKEHQVCGAKAGAYVFGARDQGKCKGAGCGEVGGSPCPAPSPNVHLSLTTIFAG